MIKDKDRIILYISPTMCRSAVLQQQKGRAKEKEASITDNK